MEIFIDRSSFSGTESGPITGSSHCSDSPCSDNHCSDNQSSDDHCSDNHSQTIVTPTIIAPTIIAPTIIAPTPKITSLILNKCRPMRLKIIIFRKKHFNDVTISIFKSVFA